MLSVTATIFEEDGPYLYILFSLGNHKTRSIPPIKLTFGFLETIISFRVAKNKKICKIMLIS